MPLNSKNVDRAPNRVPRSRTPAAHDDSGRGLLLIEDLTGRRWGYDLLGSAAAPRGKGVWALLVTK
ncbi:hypothetical protein [Streptomyces beigongshangae]|uniref:hypothetical protein n=1 Tax=Streptomyces beigongshangae TaxID=2841597 RepID=UPI001C865921|nr:hypothetical protein [Streptomyces sp. REN17]